MDIRPGDFFASKVEDISGKVDHGRGHGGARGVGDRGHRGSERNALHQEIVDGLREKNYNKWKNNKRNLSKKQLSENRERLKTRIEKKLSLSARINENKKRRANEMRILVCLFICRFSILALIYLALIFFAS